MLGLMQNTPLLLSSIIAHAARWHGESEVVSRMGVSTVHRTTYATTERRARRLAKVLGALGVTPGDRIATLAWNSYRHLELYWAISGIGAVCHTINPRLADEDIAYIVEHAGDSVIFVDPDLIPIVDRLLAAPPPSLRQVVVMASMDDMPAWTLPPGIDLLCYEALMERSDEGFDWPRFDENTASALCYTSGTTGRPKGVLYSHRSAVLHALAANGPDAYGFRATDRILLATSMFHATAWGWPYCAAMSGAALVMCGRWLDGATVLRTIAEEHISFSGGVPTIWHGVLEAARKSGAMMPSLRRLMIAGSACPLSLIEGFKAYDVDVYQAWGMTETSPIVTHHMPIPATAGLDPAASAALRLKQGRPIYGADIKIIDAAGLDLPHDGEAFGDLLTRGPWVCREYLHRGHEDAADDDGWFRTGDVATINRNGYVHLVDRSKDVVKSGGEWISSIALENIACAHPDVGEAAVIRARHPKWEERPLLLVAAREGRTVDTEALLQSFEGKVARWWIPDAVVVLDELPHGATGKINKLKLREAWQDLLVQRMHAS